MASFVLSMANTFQIKYGTMQGYVNAIKELHTHALGSVGDPLDGVLDWSKFMHALHVQSWVDSSVESHVMVPFGLMLQVLLRLDKSCRTDVALGCMILMMYYTMSRSETPLPKSRTSFDVNKHVRRRDVRINQHLGPQVVEWGMGVVKNSSRQDKAAPTRHWKPVGACSGVLSMFYWLSLYLGMSAWESEDSPFFYDSEGMPYTYIFMLRLFRTHISKLPGFTWDMAKIYGFHGLRVLGFNCARAGAGEEVAVLQGGWRSEAFRVYSRQEMSRLLAMPQIGADYAARHTLPGMPMDALPVPSSALPHDGPVAAGESRPPTTHVDPSALLDGSRVSTSPSSRLATSFAGGSGVADLPVDAIEIRRSAVARHYTVWTWQGRTYDSRPKLRRAYHATKEFLTEIFAFGYTHVAAPDESNP